MVKWIIVAILLLPAAEIAAFVAVASAIGFGFALLLMLATTLCGFWVLRHAGRGGLTQLRAAVGRQETAGFRAHASILLTVLGGLLLVVPGFITDLIGGLMLLGPVRQWFAALFGGADATAARTPGGVVDLDPEEWRQIPDRELGDPRRRPDR